MAKSEIADKLLEQSSNILQAISTEVSKGYNFALDQLPDVASTYVAYGRVMGSIYIVISLLLLLFGAGVLIWAIRAHDADEEARGAVAGALGIPSIVIGIVAGLINLSDFVMVWFAPKVWLIREIAHLVK